MKRLTLKDMSSLIPYLESALDLLYPVKKQFFFFLLKVKCLHIYTWGPFVLCQVVILANAFSSLNNAPIDFGTLTPRGCDWFIQPLRPFCWETEVQTNSNYFLNSSYYLLAPKYQRLKTNGAVIHDWFTNNKADSFPFKNNEQYWNTVSSSVPGSQHGDCK